MTDHERTTTADIAGREDDTERLDDTERHDDVDAHGTITEGGQVADRQTTDADEDRQLSRDKSERVDTDTERLAPLFDDADTTRFRERWVVLQTAFVDEPRDAVSKADELVAELMQQLAKRFNQERASLEGQWSRGEDVSTEDLRVSLQRYRSFFERLLSA
jgi:hypothetical protein